MTVRPLGKIHFCAVTGGKVMAGELPGATGLRSAAVNMPKNLTVGAPLQS
jgi:hypothetical protein